MRNFILVFFISLISCVNADPSIIELNQIPETVTDTYLLVKGKTAKGDTVTVTGGITAVKTTADPETGYFEVLVGLEIGAENILTLESRNRLNQITDSTSLRIRQQIPSYQFDPGDTTPPEKPKLNPVPEETLNQRLLVNGYAMDADKLTILNAAYSYEVTPSQTGGYFEKSIDLLPGQLNSIIVYAKSRNGIQSEPVFIKVTHLLGSDSPSGQPPETPEITNMQASTWKISQTLTGYAEPYCVIRIEGGADTVQGLSNETGAFQIGVELKPNQINHLKIVAVNAANVLSGPVFADIIQTQAPLVTQYPIILAHGNGGFDKILWIEYFRGIQALFEAKGIEVYVTVVPPFQTVEKRAISLKEQILSLTSSKVNIIAHSMGGLDGRFLVTHLDMADRVSSLTTIATPHRGSPLADIVFWLASDYLELAVDFLLHMFGQDINTWRNITEEYVTNVFNLITPDQPNVSYYSYTGVADPFGETGFFVLPVFYTSWAITEIYDGPNDGLVSVESAKWGEFLGTVPADHYGEVGHMLPPNDFDYSQFFLDHIYFLQQNGH